MLGLCSLKPADDPASSLAVILVGADEAGHAMRMLDTDLSMLNVSL